MDHVDKITKQWNQARPELDVLPMAVIGRLYRLQKIWGPEVDKVFKEFGLSNVQFDILATLRRSQSAISPTDLYTSAMLSSGAITANLDKLEEKQLLRRLPNEDDRRSCKIELTEEGFHLINKVVELHLENEARLLSVLSIEEQQTLGTLLRKCLLPMEKN